MALFLGGQRPEQLLRAQVHDVDLDQGTLKLLDPKGRRTEPRLHVLPILAAFDPEIRWLLDHSKDLGSSNLFATGVSDKPMLLNTVSRHVRKISVAMVSDGTANTPFRLSDLRRTAETMMASLEIAKDVRAQLQSHGLGGVQDRHYDRHDYLPQKRKALSLWVSFLDELAGGKF